MEMLAPSVCLALGAGGLVGARARSLALLKALLVAGVLICPLPFGNSLNLGMVVVGLFGKVSALGLLVVGGAWGGRYVGFKGFSPPAFLFLSIFGGVIFLDNLGFLPISFIYASPGLAWASLCLWGGVAFCVDRVLGGCFVLVLIGGMCFSLPTPYTLFMDIYLWLGALVGLLMGVKPPSHP
ncbi:hypothetical protein [Helicobacter vulpis]|uniref:hypothetical protein n=1 Tax=Helicobacter vulpis TaxID=2316076 RepID=UPI000EB1A4B3|nr:hypothetical protein [Helicobacter vulpis]